MKQNELQTWKAKTPIEVQKELADLYAKLERLKIETALGKIKSGKEIGKTKRTIAQLHTIIQEQGKN